MLVLGGYSQRVFGQCLFHQLEQQADQDAGAAKSDDVKDSSPDCCQLNPSSAEESYFPQIGLDRCLISVARKEMTSYPESIVTSIEYPPKAA